MMAKSLTEQEKEMLTSAELKALEIHDRTPGSVHACPPWVLKALADLRAENARLQDGYDSLKCQYDEEHDELLGYKALAERRKKALEPLAQCAEDSPPTSPDSHTLYDGAFVGIVLGDARRARAAIDITPDEAREE